MYRYIKALAGFVGGISPWTALGILTVLHVHVDLNLVVTIAALSSPILGTLATVLAPKNADAKAVEDAKAEELIAEAIEAADGISHTFTRTP